MSVHNLCQYCTNWNSESETCNQNVSIAYRVDGDCSRFSSASNNNQVIVYHGSKEGIVGRIRPDYEGARDKCDFGRGFYTGVSTIQPKTLVAQKPSPVFYTILLELDNLNIKKFDADFDWVIAICYFRKLLGRLNSAVLASWQPLLFSFCLSKL